MPKRCYHIAFELGVSPRRFIRELASAGVHVGNQMVVIPTELEERIRQVWRAQRVGPPSAAAPAAEPDVAGATAVALEEPPVTGTEDAIEEQAATVPVEAAPRAREAAPVEEAFETAVEEPGPVAGPEAPASSQEEPALPVPTAEEVPAVSPEESAAVADEDQAPAEVMPAAAQVTEASPEEGAEPAAEETKGRAARSPRGKRSPGAAPDTSNLIPTIDPRAGRLVKEAPRGGIPGVTAPPRGRSGGGMEIADLNPTIPQSDRAPGARRDSHRRSSIPERFRGKRGKETFHMRRRSSRSKKEPTRPRPTAFDVEPPTSVKKFSELSGYKAAEIIKVLFKNHKMMVNVNSMLDQDTLEILALELELDLKFVKRETQEDLLVARVQQQDDPADLVSRPPVVTILGHVDHGKTTLLDKIRQSDVAAHEAGGITQHISASQVNLGDGRKITFIDTPGHEAFTEMRARGAKVTDVVVLIVAADDGVMPQTEESISHVKAAGVPLIVAITKVDKANANPTRVRQQLAEHEVYVEGYGGTVSAFEVSGITGEGVDELLEHIALMAEVESERFRANPKRQAEGTVLEAENSPQRGVVTTVLVQRGTLRPGDAVLVGETWGTVRAMFNYRGEQVEEANPGDPIEIIGLEAPPPNAGSRFYVLGDANKARDMAEIRRQESRAKELAAQSKPTSVESLLGAISEGKIQELNVVLKADVKGSIEPIRGLLQRMGTSEVRVKVLHSGVGAVNDSDVILAAASNAWVIGFNVNIDDRARDRAKMTGVEIRVYRIIYDIEKDVRDALEGKLAPELVEVVQGHAEILAIFSSSRLGNIAGCRVRDGIIRRDSHVRVRRDGKVVHESRMASLRREKDEVREVKEGFECGIRLEGWDDFKEGDEFEAYTVEHVRRTLA